MMYAKLIVRNLKRSTKEYSVYMMTLTLSVMLMYSFHSLALSNEIKAMSDMMEGFFIMIIIASCFIVLVLGWLVYYISKFIIEKRSKEFGMYMLMGMTRRQIATMFLIEQLSMGMLAFIIGCILGVVAHQVLYAIIMNMIGETFAFKISFSSAAGGITFLCFVLIYVLEILRERRYLRKKKIYELLYSNRKNEKSKNSKHLSIVCFILGVILFFVGIKVSNMLFSEEVSIGLGMVSTIVLIASSIILIYLGLAYVITGFINHRKNIKYKGNMLYISTQLCTRLKTSRVVLSLLSILVLISFMLVTLGMKFNESFDKMIDQEPFDITAMQFNERDINVNSITSFLDKNKITYRDYKYKTYHLDDSALPLVKGLAWEDFFKKEGEFVYLRYSDYRELEDMLGYHPINLATNEYAILALQEDKEVLEKNAKNFKLKNLKFKGVDVRSLGERYSAITIVVPDYVLENVEDLSSYGTYVVKTEVPSTQEWLTTLLDPYTKDNQKEDGTSYIGLTTRYSILMESTLSVISVTFALIYLAIIFSLVATTVLALQQMSDIWKQKYAYQMLWKLGASKRELYAMLRKQIAIYFFVPLVIPLLYIFPLVRSADSLFELSNIPGTMAPYAIQAIFFYLIIYICYYLLAYMNSKRNIEIEDKY